MSLIKVCKCALTLGVFFSSFFASGQVQGVKNIPLNAQHPVLDGRLTEECWQNSFRISGFRLFEPKLNGQPSEMAEAYIFYTDKYLYVGIHCPNTRSNGTYAQVMERDVSLDADDYAEIHLDTYNDRSHALVFRTNPIGTRFDYEISNNGEQINNSWNTFWDVATSRDSSGWNAEYRIPFYSLRYQPNTENKMRVRVLIKYKLINEKLIFPLNNPQAVPVLYNFQNSMEIGFKNLPSSKPVFITPYIKSDVYQQNVLNSQMGKYESQTKWMSSKNYSKSKFLDQMLSNTGVDVKYRVGNNKVIDLSLNTDFAQVEADDRLVNVTRFSINLPEKRPFFLENADIFNSDGFSHRLFNSRQVGIDNGVPVPMIGGLRFNGFSGQNQYGIMSVITAAMPERNLLGYNMNVVRGRKILDKKGSSIGVISTSKIATNGNDYNIMTGVDGLVRTKKNTRISYVLAATFDKQKGNWKPMYGISVNTFQSNGFGFEARFREYTEAFNPELGFVSEPNTKRITVNTGFRRTYSKHPIFSYFTIGHYIRKSWRSLTGKDDIFQTNIYVNTVFKKGFRAGMFFPSYIQDFIYTPWSFSANAIIPTGSYKMLKGNIFFNTGTAYRYLISVDAEFGKFYGGKQFTINFLTGYDINKNLRTEVGGSMNQFVFPIAYGSTNVQVNRLYGRLKFGFSPKSFLNLYSQYDNVQKSVGLNLRYRYMPREGTDFYVVYNLNTNTETETFNPHRPFVRDQVFILKFSKTFIR